LSARTALACGHRRPKQTVLYQLIKVSLVMPRGSLIAVIDALLLPDPRKSQIE